MTEHLKNRDMTLIRYPIPTTSREPDRDRSLAWAFFAGTFVALIANGLWSLVVGTASPGGDEADLVRGWEGVLRNSPAYALLIVVASTSLLFAARAYIRGVTGGRATLVASSLVLLFALSSVTRDCAEVVMTTRAATVSWLTFGVDAVIVGLLLLTVVRRRARRRSMSS